MPRKPKAKPAELTAISAELLEQFGNGPMTAEAINAASLAFKNALIERALGGEMRHLWAIRPARPNRSLSPTSATALTPRPC